MVEKGRSKNVESILDRIPEVPGVYQYFDEEGSILYVGKAKNLKKRVLSYFNKNHEDSPKTRILVRKIRDIKYIVVSTEQDALLLENNLIKQYKPRYNVLLKDDKSYPSICITKEPFPKVFQTRNLELNAEYFGPYSSVYMVRSILGLIRQLYPIRTCKLAMLESEIQSGKYKVCLEYHIKKCMGPCVGLQSKEDYNKDIVEIREILKGNLQSIMRDLRSEMKKRADELAFEEAQKIKDRIAQLELYKSKSTVVNAGLHNIEVYAYEETEQSAIVNNLFLINGSIVRGYTLEYRKRVEENKENLFAMAIFELRQRFPNTSREIIVPFMPEGLPEDILVSIPQRGDKKKILDLSVQNVRQYKLDLLKQAEKLNPEQRVTRILTQVKKDLRLHELPFHIECFDNSNIQGAFPVSSCVVFKNAKASKKDYRHFNVKTVEGPDDFASMQEVILRRYSRLVEESQSLPQLIIVDGGKGQLSASVDALRQMNLFGKIAIVGIAKNLEELFFPGDSVPLYLDKNSETLKLIQQMRDEAHRFGISHHRNRRSKQQIHSELDEIKGIGDKTKSQLLKAFKSVKRIRESTMEELIECVGSSKASLLFNHFNKNE